MTGKTFRVVVTHEPGAWIADIVDLEGGHTYARNLPGLDESVREVITMIEDLPSGAEADLKIDYEFRTDDQHWLRLHRRVSARCRTPGGRP